MTIKSKTTLAIDFDRHHYRFNHNRQINFRLTQYIKYTVLQLIQHLKSKSFKIEMHRSRKHTNKIRKSSQAALLPHQRFPSNIRTELRMACVLRGMSSLKQGPQKTQKLQQVALSNFYHGKGEKSPSQIDMLVNGIGAYKDLYDLKTQLIVVKRKGIKKKVNKNQLQLKQMLSRDDFLTYTADDQINTADMVKKHRNNSNELVSGRQLFGLAQKGMRDYRKALAFTKDKWDFKKTNHWNWARRWKTSPNMFVGECIFI